MTRALEEKDLAWIKEIHEKYYKSEFALPDFMNFLFGFCVEYDGRIIVAGGIRPIAESIIVTDQSAGLQARMNAFAETIEVSRFATKHCGYHELHAFIQNSAWKRLLVRAGFVPTKGDALVLGV